MAITSTSIHHAGMHIYKYYPTSSASAIHKVTIRDQHVYCSSRLLNMLRWYFHQQYTCRLVTTLLIFLNTITSFGIWYQLVYNSDYTVIDELWNHCQTISTLLADKYISGIRLNHTVLLLYLTKWCYHFLLIIKCCYSYKNNH